MRNLMKKEEETLDPLLMLVSSGYKLMNENIAYRMMIEWLAKNHPKIVGEYLFKHLTDIPECFKILQDCDARLEKEKTEWKRRVQ